MSNTIDVVENIASMTIRMESDDDPPSYNDVYLLLLLAMVEIRKLKHEISVLKDTRNL